MTWLTPLLVFLGGGAGAVLRWAVGLGIPGWWGVLIANIVGSFLLAGLVASPWAQQRWVVALLGTGLLGGFTTYSTFNAQVLEAAGRQAWSEVVLRLGLTVAACLLGGALGLWIGGQLPR